MDDAKSRRVSVGVVAVATSESPPRRRLARSSRRSEFDRWAYQRAQRVRENRWWRTYREPPRKL